jgi:pSer/pThr/pTyr-binding forkhead associated (FHA) protein
MDVNLVLLKKDSSQKPFTLPSSVTVIGRRSNCDLHIPITSVSRRHCQLNQDQGVLKIRDLGSRNGTYVNGKRVEETVIKAGDQMKVGPLTFVFQIDGQPKDITMPVSAAKKRREDKGPMDDQETADSDIFAELDELDELEDLDSLEANGPA